LTRDEAAARSKTLSHALARRPRPPRPRIPRVVLPLGQGRSIAIASPDLSLASLVHVVGELFATLTSASSAGLALSDVVNALLHTGESKCQP
jgi:hypothetical protein